MTVLFRLVLLDLVICSCIAPSGLLFLFFPFFLYVAQGLHSLPVSVLRISGGEKRSSDSLSGEEAFQPPLESCNQYNINTDRAGSL